MPTIDSVLIGNALQQMYNAALERQPNRSTNFLNLLRKQKGGGKNIAYNVEFGTAEGKSYSEGQDITTFGNDTPTNLVLPWKFYGEDFEVTGHSMDVSASSNQDVADVMGNAMVTAAGRAATKVAKDILIGTGTGTDMLGILTAAGGLRATGVYGGIDRAVNTQWAANEVNVAGPIAYNTLVDNAKLVYDADGTYPDLWVTGSTQHANIGKLPEYKNVQRQMDVTARGQKIIGGAGPVALEFMGAPIVIERQMPADAVLGIDLGGVFIEYLPPSPERVKNGEVIGMIAIAGTPEEQLGAVQGSTGLMASIIRLGKKGTKVQYHLECTLNIVVKRPKACLYIRGLT